MAKILFAHAGIPQARWVTMTRGEDKTQEIEEKLGYPCFVKPANAGSSMGITKAHDRGELEKGIREAFLHDEKILVEEMMYGTEVECSVIGNLQPEAAPVVGEIAPAAEFYDYEAKYYDSNSVLTIPAKLDGALVEKVRQYAVQGLSRL